MASNHEELEQITEKHWLRAMGNLAHVFVFCLHTKVEVGQWNMKSSSMFSVFNFVFALIWAPSDLELASILVLDEQKTALIGWWWCWQMVFVCLSLPPYFLLISRKAIKNDGHTLKTLKILVIVSVEHFITMTDAAVRLAGAY